MRLFIQNFLTLLKSMFKTKSHRKKDRLNNHDEIMKLLQWGHLSGIDKMFK